MGGFFATPFEAEGARDNDTLFAETEVRSGVHYDTQNADFATRLND